MWLLMNKSYFLLNTVFPDIHLKHLTEAPECEVLLVNRMRERTEFGRKVSAQHSDTNLLPLEIKGQLICWVKHIIKASGIKVLRPKDFLWRLPNVGLKILSPALSHLVKSPAGSLRAARPGPGFAAQSNGVCQGLRCPQMGPSLLRIHQKY